MTGPTDTIREALTNPRTVPTSPALAALTEVEQQLAAAVQWEGAFRSAERACVAAETALAEANKDAVQLGSRLVAAERRADDLADALREIADAHVTPKSRAIARAALDRQEQPDA